jgi:hypothetical protein
MHCKKDFYRIFVNRSEPGSAGKVKTGGRILRMSWIPNQCQGASGLPVIELKSCDPAEFPGIVGDQHGIVSSGHRCNEHVIGADQSAPGSQIRTDKTVFVGAKIIKRQALEWCKKELEPLQIGIHPEAVPGTEKQLRLDDTADGNLGGGQGTEMVFN